MPTAAETAATDALVALIADTAEDQEAVLFAVLAQAARDSGLMPPTAPYHPRDTPPKAVIVELLNRATPALDAAFQAQRAQG